MCWEFLKTSNSSEYNGWIESYFFSEDIKLLSKNASYVSMEHSQSMVAEFCKKYPNIHFADAVDFVFNKLKEDMK
ncbi:hypothetical protein HK13_13685 [Acetobacter indonesiensis]|nr:hypothetical protein HK13_13685 [Acetobacter indonesiensis]